MISLLLDKPTWVPRGSYPALPVDAVVEHPGAGGAGDRGAKVKLGLAKEIQDNTFKTVHIFQLNTSFAYPLVEKTGCFLGRNLYLSLSEKSSSGSSP